MNPLQPPDADLERRPSSRLLDVLIRGSFIGALVVLCYQVLSPFLPLMVWSIILAVTMYPLHQWLAGRVGGRQWFASFRGERIERKVHRKLFWRFSGRWSRLGYG
jgi:hypothetical protein